MPHLTLLAAGEWLDSLASRLATLKHGVEDEYCKYSGKSIPAALLATRASSATRSRAQRCAGLEQLRQRGEHLQSVADHILNVAALLAQFRCAVRGRICSCPLCMDDTMLRQHTTALCAVANMVDGLQSSVALSVQHALAESWSW